MIEKLSDSIKKEIIALQNLRGHENILNIFHHEREGDVVKIYMELCSSDLHRYAKTEELNGMDIMEIIFQTAMGLDFVHSHGVVHRDIKPGNILVKYKADGQATFKLADFGLAFLLREDERTQSALMSAQGTVSYMAPEVIVALDKNEMIADGSPYSVDVYSLGVVFYWLLVQEVPLKRSQKTIDRVDIGKVVKGNVKDSEFHLLIISMLQYEPEKRPTTKAVLTQVNTIMNLAS